MPVCIGERTAIAAAIATQASAAVPPASRMRMPASAALGCSQATAPFVPKTVERPPRSGRRALISPAVAPSSLRDMLVIGSFFAQDPRPLIQFIGLVGGKFEAERTAGDHVLNGGRGIYIGGTLLSILLSL